MPKAGEVYYFASKTNRGGNPVVVLLHGAGGNHLHWPHNLRRLTNFQVYAPDLPGHGKSGGLGHQSIKAYADEIAAWMDLMKIKEAFIGGHSMGGAIAQMLAVSYPKKVRGLILVATGPRLNVNQNLLFKLSTPSSTPAAIDDILKWSWMPGTEQKLLDKIRQQMMETRSAVLYGDYLACNNFDLTASLKKIRMPTLVIAGENDKMTPLDLNRQLDAGIKKSRISIIPNAGHMVMLEKPDSVAKEAAAFLAATG